MIRLGISVEGATEREFVNQLLRPHLQPFSIHTVAIDLRGNVSLDKIRGVLPALLGSFDHVSTLYDFYGFKGRDERTIEALEHAILALVSSEQSHRFTPYVQKYEFEALLFAIPQQVVAHLKGKSEQLESMQSAVKLSGSAEAVNDSVDTSPSHCMKQIFAGYSKKLHGPAIIESAGIDAVRSECPRFHQWLTKLEKLASL
jgi:Domain of unknown function (DUF4276)